MYPTPPKMLLDELSAYPHITQRITIFWGTNDLDEYLTGLLLDTRDGSRQGFKLSEASAIHRLLTENEILLKTKRPRSGDQLEWRD